VYLLEESPSYTICDDCSVRAKEKNNLRQVLLDGFEIVLMGLD
jgi:hypothetical protein